MCYEKIIDKSSQMIIFYNRVIFPVTYSLIKEGTKRKECNSQVEYDLA